HPLHDALAPTHPRRPRLSPTRLVDRHSSHHPLRRLGQHSPQSRWRRSAPVSRSKAAKLSSQRTLLELRRPLRHPPGRLEIIFPLPTIASAALQPHQRSDRNSRCHNRRTSQARCPPYSSHPVQIASASPDLPTIRSQSPLARLARFTSTSSS